MSASAPAVAQPCPVIARRAGQGVAYLAPQHTQVLLVDDEELVRQTTALQLRDLAYEISACASAALALEAVEGGLVPDILVTDYVMAQMNGVQLAAELRQRFPGLPVLIVSGYTDLNAEQLSRFEVLNKPYRRVELAEPLVCLLPGGAKQAK